LLDISEDVFTNVFIINASDILDFIKEEGSVKLRDRFEKIFFKDVIFKKVLETVRKEYNVVQKQQELNNSKIQEKIAFLKRLKEIIESSKKVDNYEKQLEKFTKKQKELQEKLTVIDQKILQRQDEDKLKKLQKKKSEYVSKRDDVTSKIYYYTESKQRFLRSMEEVLTFSGKCPLCFQDINQHTSEKIKKEYQDAIDSNDRLKKEFEVLKIECDEKLAKIESLEDQIQKAVNNYTSEQWTVKTAMENINQQVNFFRENYKDHMGLVQEFNSVKADLLKIRNENGSLETEMTDLDLLAHLFDNSSGGILNYFIDKVLKILNQIILKFIKQMNMDFTFHFDESLRLKFDAYDTLNLNNFSGGEVKIINFIVLFSLLEFFYHTINFKPSILIIDEIADTAISSSKVELIFGILDTFHKENNVGIYCLSHDYTVERNPVINFNRVIELEKVDGFTQIRSVKYNK
jgi:DNA repair exonuclease SbcCD ATPase subunit